MIKFSTYTSSLANALVFIETGVSHIIIDHPLLSIRSFSDSDSKNLNCLIPIFQTLENNDQISVSLNCDFIYHHDYHDNLLCELIDILEPYKKIRIRIQDPGLLFFFKEKLPLHQLIYNPEIGNHNTESITNYQSWCHRQVLSNEIPVTQLKRITASLPQSEYLVHGSILIQYSLRKFLSWSSNLPQRRYGSDEDYPKRKHLLYETEHGHFMYAHFDKSLLRQIPDLLTLSLSHWLFDLRHLPLSNACQIIALYKKSLKTYRHSPDLFYETIDDHDQSLKKLSPHPLKPGFFKINNTDQDRSYTTPDPPENYEEIGKIIDVVKGKIVTVELQKTIVALAPVYIGTPEGKLLFFETIPFTTLAQDRAHSLKAFKLYTIPWSKGISSGSRLYMRCSHSENESNSK